MNQSVHQLMEPIRHIRVLDEWQDTIPEDLYIPPAAFEILLEHFEGPLDFLIYLIQKNGFDLLQLDIAPVATQYLNYIESMKSLDIELKADYLVMAALLADLKSRLLLPKSTQPTLEQDPKKALIHRLENYLRIKNAATDLNKLSVLNRDTFEAVVELGEKPAREEQYDVEMLKLAMQAIFQRPAPVLHHIQSEPVQLEERIHFIEKCLHTGALLDFSSLLNPRQGRMGIVVTFMAILELSRQQKLCIVSSGIDTPLTIQGLMV